MDRQYAVEQPTEFNYYRTKGSSPLVDPALFRHEFDYMIVLSKSNIANI